MQNKMVLKGELFESIPSHIYELNYEENIHELKDHVGEEALNLNLPPMLRAIRKIIFASFPCHMLESV
jgi:hypothetical protein